VPVYCICLIIGFLMFAGDDYSIWPGYIFMRVFAIRCGMESTAVVTETMRVEETLKFNIYSDYL